MAQATLIWLRSPFGRRITQLEEHASTAEAMAAMDSYAEGLALAPPEKERADLVRSLDTSVGATELALEATLAASLGAAMAANVAP